MLTVEKVGGTSMSNYEAVRDNVILGKDNNNPLTNRILVVSAYSGITDLLLEHKKTGEPGVYACFANDGEPGSWKTAMNNVRAKMLEKNIELFSDDQQLSDANQFIEGRLCTAERCLEDLERLCKHGHFSLKEHLITVREMLASIGEAHSARNMAALLTRDGVATSVMDLTGWDSDKSHSMDEHIQQNLAAIDISKQLIIATGYAHCETGIMATFDRGYSEMTFSRIAVLSDAKEALIHKEYHLSSADPKVVGENMVVPIGRTNYDVADQLANLGMEAIHPKAAKGLRQKNIPLRVKNTFEPEHNGTLITRDYISSTPCVEIIAGRKQVYALALFDQDMVGNITAYEKIINDTVHRFRASIVAKDINANTITVFLDANPKKIRRIERVLSESFSEAEISLQQVAVVSAIGSDLQVPGILAKTAMALAEAGISILAVHQSMRQVDMQFIVNENDYELAIKSLHRCLVEVHNHGTAICAA